jgi:hypothetical protein
MSELHDVDRRLAVLEQIARDTATALADIRAELRLMRTEMQDMRKQQHEDLRWLIGIMFGVFGLTLTGFVGLLAVMAHGFHWL